MQGSQGRSWVIDKFGAEPKETTKYRLPLALALLVIFTALFLLNPERGLSDLLPFALVALLLFNFLGDRIWAHNLAAAAWLRLTGNVVAFLVMAAFLVGLYLARDGSG